MRSFYLTFVLLLALAFAGCSGDSSQSVDVEYSSNLALSSEQEPDSSSQEKILSSSENVSSFVELSSSLAESSSSSVESSSSSAPRSSSSLPDYTCKFSYGTMTDERDGRVYRTVTFNPLTRVYEPEFAWVEDSVETTWMIENLNYAYLEPTETLDSSSMCYYDDDEIGNLCEKYGRRYLWSAAMDSAALFSEDAKGCGYDVTCFLSGNVRGVCPEGWHVPDVIEWFDFKMSVYGFNEETNLASSSLDYLGNKKGVRDYFSKLKICSDFTNWDVGLPYFFSYDEESLYFEELYIEDFYRGVKEFWVVSQSGCVQSLRIEYVTQDCDDYFKTYFESVRCVKDKV